MMTPRAATREDVPRRGLATALYRACEHAARSAGFRRFELMATAPGEPLYRHLGFVLLEPVELVVGGVAIGFARMGRAIDAIDSSDVG